MVKGYYSHDINEETYQRAGLLAQGHTAGRRQKLYHAVPLLCWVWDEDLWGLTWCSQTCLLHGPWWTRHEENPSLTVSTQPGGTVFRPRPWGLINENKWMGQYNLMPYWKKPFSKMEILIDLPTTLEKLHSLGELPYRKLQESGLQGPEAVLCKVWLSS